MSISPLPSIRKSLYMFLNNLYVCPFIVMKVVAKNHSLTGHLLFDIRLHFDFLKIWKMAIII